jgi:hypothetical protein
MSLPCHQTQSASLVLGVSSAAQIRSGKQMKTEDIFTAFLKQETGQGKRRTHNVQ